MPATRIKQRGTAFENRVKKHLEDKGWDVFRSAGSRSPADLVAFRDTRILLIQCKINIDTFTPAERDELWALSTRIRVYALIISRAENNAFMFWKMRMKRGKLAVFQIVEPKL